MGTYGIVKIKVLQRGERARRIGCALAGSILARREENPAQNRI
jgi:hypothetical protein